MLWKVFSTYYRSAQKRCNIARCSLQPSCSARSRARNNSRNSSSCMNSLNPLSRNHTENIRRLCLDTRVHGIGFDTPGDDNSDSCNWDSFTVDWTKSYGMTNIEINSNSSSSRVILCFPRTTNDVSIIMKYCNDNDIPVIPQGGNTGLVGGGVPRAAGSISSSDHRECQLLLSLSRMNQIIEIDEESSIVTCEAGVILENLNNQCKEKGLMVPLDLGAKGSCQIGGNVSTNAGGLRVIRYGSMFQNVVGLEVVLPNGEVLDILRKVRKDNSGFHLKNLFIGSEGTLGVVTKVSMALVAQPKDSKVILLKLSSFDKVSRLLRFAKTSLAEIVSAFEFMDLNSLESIREMYPLLYGKIPSDWMDADRGSGINTTGIGPCVVLMELSGGTGSLNEDRMQSMLTTLTEESLIEDGLISGDSKQESLFWSIRENVPVALMAVSRLRPASDMVDKSASYGKLFKYDISLSLCHMDTLVPHLVENLIAMDYKIYPGGHVYETHIQTTSLSSNRALGATKHEHYAFQICCFGHAGDQNLHLNMLFRPIMPQPKSEDKPNEFPSPLSSPPPPPPPFSFPASALTMVEIAAIQSDLDVLIYRFTSQARGSISAEHGIGQAKVNVLPLYKSPAELQTMRSLKLLFDPKNILNPGKVVDLAAAKWAI